MLAINIVSIENDKVLEKIALKRILIKFKMNSTGESKWIVQFESDIKRKK